MGVGISFLIALKATVLLLFFALLRNLGFVLLSLPFLYASLVSFLISFASHELINLPMLLGKKSDGSFPIWSIIMFSPYIYFVRTFSILRRLSSGEEPYSEVSEGLYVGGWPSSPSKLPPGNPAIIDCTCEFPKIKELEGHSYLCVPTWDTRAPRPGEIESAVKWACRKRAQNRPIFVHCAYGMISIILFIVCIIAEVYKLLTFSYPFSTISAVINCYLYIFVCSWLGFSLVDSQEMMLSFGV